MNGTMRIDGGCNGGCDEGCDGVTPAVHLSEEIDDTPKAILQRSADLRTNVIIARDSAREHVGVLLADDALLALGLVMESLRDLPMLLSKAHHPLELLQTDLAVAVRVRLFEHVIDELFIDAAKNLIDCHFQLQARDVAA